MSTTEVSPLTVDELPFLGEMLLTALFWRGEREYPDDLVHRHPRVAMYHEDWGRAGDCAYVAHVGDRRAGAVWYRAFTEEVHGDGFVDPWTPELAVAVVDSFRGRGIGRALMEAIHERARSDGVRQISLSVNMDNPARRLYENLGYVDLLPLDERERMLLDLQ